MSQALSPNTQAILLLTAPLIAGRGKASPDLLSPGEYKRLARHLREIQGQPADLLASNAGELLKACQPVLDNGRLQRLLARGFLLSQVVENWQTRAIWVVSRADANYPRRLKARLKEDAPPILYGCGDMAILETGGLAMVGSRNADDDLLEYTHGVGRLAARAKKTVVSGGARGIDQAAMRGALEGGGKVIGVLADSLEKTAMNREHRNMLMDGQLVLISPYDPGAGFNVGHAMQRNKLIYALADAALVVSADYQKGGTWAGAVEQLDKLRFVPVYIRSNGITGKGLDALRGKGALGWPNPQDTDAFVNALAVKDVYEKETAEQNQLSFAAKEQSGPAYDVQPKPIESEPTLNPAPAAKVLNPAEELFAKVSELLQRIEAPKTDAEVAADLNVSKSQAKEWLQRLADEGVLVKLVKPIRYVANREEQPTLFEQMEQPNEPESVPGKQDDDYSDDAALYNGPKKREL